MRTRSKGAHLEEGASEAEFQRFGLLPAELRVNIWDMWIEMNMPEGKHPYRVRPYVGRKSVTPAVAVSAAESSKSSEGRCKESGSERRRSQWDQVVKVTATSDLTPITRRSRDMLRVCREARYEVLKQFPDVIPIGPNGELRFNAARELVYLDIVDFRVIRLMLQNTPAFTQTVQHLGLAMMAPFPRWSHRPSRQDEDGAPRLDFLLKFPNMRSLSLLSMEEVDNAELHFAAGHKHFMAWRFREGWDYKRPTRVGNREAPEKHECMYCAVNQFDDFRMRMRGERRRARDPTLSPEQVKWLKEVEFRGLVGIKPRRDACELLEFDGIEAEAEKKRLKKKASRAGSASSSDMDSDLDNSSDDDSDDD